MFGSICGSSLLLLLLVTSFRRRRLHSGSNILVMHLMLLDLIICGITYPLSITITYRGMRGTQVDINCHAFLYFHMSVIFTENWANLVLAINRLFAIALPFLYKKITTIPGLIFMIVLPWVMGLGVTLPVYFGIGGALIQTIFPLRACTPAPRPDGYGIAWITLGAYVPLASIGLTYLSLCGRWIIKKVQKRQISPMQNEQAERQTAAVKARQIRLAKMLIASYLWHCMCFLSPPILLPSFPWLLRRYPMLIQLWLLKTAPMWGYVASPFIFLALSSDYQTGVRDLLNSLRGRRRQMDTSNRRSQAFVTSTVGSGQHGKGTST
ncbi:hypothetical protein BV898_08528 [Hypsibius exemplaris]|uniref:G-protein coupled receptors family 1 profile domain-containing protein n=1 Tax=Hypsibius exemplaris TaxID=2072580 RepID=A0A1W0WQE9_HYPEX|nr:hypothetical protein BV898_08528 [Hypsibius exemplaris]